MDLKGKIIQFLGESSGTSKSGNPWRKREWVLETLDFGSFPRKVVFTVFGDKIDNLPLVEVGRDYVVSIDIESREFNGRWFTNINAYRVQEQVPVQGQNDATGMGTGIPPFPGTPGVSEGFPGGGGYMPDDEGDENLPF